MNGKFRWDHLSRRIRIAFFLLWVMSFALAGAVFAPPAQAACFNAYCNFGSEGWWSCGPFGCEFPDQCQYATCDPLSPCLNQTPGYINFCISGTYCPMFPACNSSCCP